MRAQPAVTIFAPRALLAAPDRWLAGGALVVREGAILELAPDARRLRRRTSAREARWIELADAVLTPGLVNAHAHLELTALRGATPAGARGSGTAFVAWIRAVLRARAALSPADWRASWERGAARALATGTTLVADIDSSGAWVSARTRARPRVRVLRELLDAGDAERTPAALATLAAALPRRAGVLAGWSAHAPHTVSDTLLAALAARVRSHAHVPVRTGARSRARAASRVHVGVHWAETRAEVEWLAHGTGPFAAVLGATPHTSGLARLAAHGLLGPHTALYHGNFPERDDPARVARAGSVLVHCPGTHAFFGRAPFDLARWERAGVAVALGTDSLASNVDLDLGRELALLRRAHPSLAPARAWDMVTRSAARAAGAADCAGELAVGAWADLCAWELPSGGRGAALEALTTGSAGLRAVWIGGRSRWRAGRAGDVW